MSTFSSQSVTDFLAATAAKTPTPGGGAVASVVGALGAALAQMVVNYTVGKKQFAAYEPALQAALSKLQIASRLLLELAEEDAAAYGAVNELSRLPEGDPRRGELPAVQLASARVPLAVAAACTDILRLLETLAPITNKYLRSDLAIAAILADAAARAGRWNVLVNLSALSPHDRDQIGSAAEKLVGDASALAANIERACGHAS